MVLDIGGIIQGMHELLQAVYTKPLDICLRFCLNFEFKILGSPILGEGVPLGGRRWYHWVGIW